MSRKIEVLTRILSNARIVDLEAHIDHEQSDDIKKFSMSVVKGQRLRHLYSHRKNGGYG